MAEAASADRGLRKEELEKALADTSAEQLRDMAARLTRSVEGMQEALKDLDIERQTLREEAEQLNNTITLMMQEMQKLNIGSLNTVDPRLAEGPLDFVGRFWEKVKPRDTAYQTSEHVGEIKKPVCGDTPTPNVQQVAREVGQHVIQNAQKIPGKLGPWWQKAQGFVSEKQSEIAEAVAKARQQQQQQQQQQSRRGSGKRGSGGYPEGGAGQDGSPPAAPADGGAAAASSGAAASAAPTSPTAPGGSGAPEAAEAEAAAAADAAAAPAEAAKAASPKAGSAPAATAAAAPEAAPKKEEEPKAERAAPAAAAAKEDDLDPTVLIEAKLKVGDGSVLPLQVNASDRNKEVARRFVQEHSLKAWFKEPLALWLADIEEKAEKFPVHVEADLSQIRKDFSKSK